MIRKAVRRAVLAAMLVPNSAWSYTFKTAVSPACHERISAPAIQRLVDFAGRNQNVSVPESSRWSPISRYLFSSLSLEEPGSTWEYPDASDRFVAMSALLGVLGPDTFGHSTLDLSSLRRVHADPSPEAQYAHCLRAPGDDGREGDLQAIAGTKSYLRELLERAVGSLEKPREQQIATAQIYLDHYGLLDIPVWEPALLMGQALHVVQDCHSHTIRSPDGDQILAVLNFVDALDRTLEPAEDGLAHSGGLDDCNEPAIALLVSRATRQSVALVEALEQARNVGSSLPLDRGLSACAGSPSSGCGWLEYDPSCASLVEAGADLGGSCCDAETRYCDSPWLEVARDRPTKPLVPSCQACPSRGPSGWATLFALVVAFAGLRRHSRLRGAQRMLATLVIASMGQAPRSAFAQGLPPGEPTDANTPTSHRAGEVFVAAEGHISVLTDTPNESPLDLSFGPALRGGYRFAKVRNSQWGVVATVEQNAWTTSERRIRVQAGVLNAGVGVEYAYADLFRSSLLFGTSTLLFDTIFHGAGSTGLFIALRPLGISFDIGDHWTVSLDPLSGTWLAPSFGEPSLNQFQYRLTVGVEWHQPVHGAPFRSATSGS